jgi:putative transposase
MGIAGIAPGPNTSRPSPEHKVYPYLLRHLDICRPNQVWGVDITFVRLRAGWMYLVAILDWYSRFVLSWALCPVRSTIGVCAALLLSMSMRLCPGWKVYPFA